MQNPNFIEVINPDGTRGSVKLPPGITNYLIDIDGTICDDIPNEEPERIPKAKEIAGAKEKINSYYDAGHIITFFTSRLESSRVATEKWLNDNGFKYHQMITNKPRGGNYHLIDDKPVTATQFVNWESL
jgi:hypothetical protein